MTILTHDIQCISKAVCPSNEIMPFGYPRFKNMKLECQLIEYKIHFLNSENKADFNPFSP